MKTYWKKENSLKFLGYFGKILIVLVIIILGIFFISKGIRVFKKSDLTETTINENNEIVQDSVIVQTDTLVISESPLPKLVIKKFGLNVVHKTQKYLPQTDQENVNNIEIEYGLYADSVRLIKLRYMVHGNKYDYENIQKLLDDIPNAPKKAKMSTYVDISANGTNVERIWITLIANYYNNCEEYYKVNEKGEHMLVKTIDKEIFR